MNYWGKFKALSKIKKRMSYFTLTVACYAAIGFLLLPYILQPIITDGISKNTHRNVKLESLEINPFSLSVALTKLSISDEHTGELFSLEYLYVNIELLSVFRQSVFFDEIEIVRPNLNVKILKSGEFNFQDLIVSGSSDEKDQSSEEVWPVEITRFRYEEGSISFADENRKTPFYNKLEGINISLDDFSTKPGDGNEHHVQAEIIGGTSVDWKGEFSLSPLKSKGKIKLFGDLTIVSDYLQDQMLVTIDQGKLDVKTDYDFSFNSEVAKFKVSNFLASIINLKLSRNDTQQEIISWNDFTVDLSELDIFNKVVIINKVSSNEVNIKGNRNNIIPFDLVDLFVLKEEKIKEVEGSVADNVVKKNNDWNVIVTEINHNNLVMNLSDLTVKPTAVHNIKINSLNITNFHPFTDEVAVLDMDVIINNRGGLRVKGDIKPLSKVIGLDMDINFLELKNYQPYINSVAAIDLQAGELSSKVKLHINASNEIAEVNIIADTTIQDFKVSDKKQKQELLSWESLSINQFKVSLPKNSIKISSIDVHNPNARLVIGSEGETNFSDLMVAKVSNNDDIVKATDSGFDAKIKAVNIENGKMYFSDSSLKPNFSAGIYSLKGNIKGLSSKELSKAKVDLKGKVDKYAPVIIKGEINPLTKDVYTEIEMLFKGIELTTFTPYSGKFAGYKIEKGKLTLDLNYKLSENELIAENIIVLNQLTLGETTESEDATSLPVSFALSLMKDAKGVIDINLPIRGNIDDPDFHYGSLVWGALGNLMLGVVSSPFSALANLAGGDSEGLDYIVFSENSAILQASEKVKLDTIAKALALRPELHLEIRGVSSSLIDHDAIAYSKLLMQLKIKPRLLSEMLTKDEQKDIVDYYEDISKLSADAFLPKEHKLTKQQIDDMQFQKTLAYLLNVSETTDSEYRMLAHQRAEKVQEYLIKNNSVPSENVFLLDSNIKPENELEDAENRLLKMPLGIKGK